MLKNNYKIVPWLIAGLFLTACADRVGLAEQKMQQIRSEPAQPVKPPPEPERVEEFTYSASQLRSPFMPPSLMLQASQAEQVEGVRPDVTRIKEPLEQFELNELTYKGSVASQSGELYGLVQRPDGSIASVKVGNYMGKNDGRIAEITPTQINLIEIVPDSRVGYVEKPASIVAAAS
ncbi:MULTISPECIES: pilus assembly protein PilP [unclassified Moraxella]|uniref:pilus assembly protein PilP n=1 Tax=unclassified Moraxella TaxID=2685852 RepID=UPI003AF95EE0